MVRLADEKMKTLLAATYFRGGSYNLDALENSFGGYIYSFQQFFAKFPAFFKASEMKPVVEGVFVSQEKIEQIAEQHLEMLVSLGSQAISAFSSATQYGVQSLDWSCAKIGHVLDLGVHVASGIKNYGECLTHVNSIGLVNCTLDTGTHAYEFTKHQGEPVLNWTANTASDLAQWAHKNVWEEQLKVILKAGLQHAGSAKDVGVNKLQDLLQEGLKNSSELLAICQPYTLPAMGGAIVLGLAAYGTRTAVQKLWSNAGTVNNNNHTIQVGLPAAVLPAP